MSKNDELEIIDFEYKQRNSIGDFVLYISKLTIRKGEIVFVFGNSGSGKSTLFNVISGIKKTPLLDDVANVFRRIEYVMHESKLLPWHTLKSNVGVINNLNGLIEEECLLNHCQSLGLPDGILKLKNWQLSLGMRQRFEIALAISNHPNLIILDEALAGIDNKNKLIVSKVLYQYVIKNNATILGAAHQISDILRIANRVIFIDGGSVKNSISINMPIEERLKLDMSDLYSLPESKILINLLYN